MSLGTVFVSEVAGTAILLLFGCGVVANVALDKSKGAGGGFLLVNFGWAIGVFAGVYVAFRSGAHLNPAVTLAMALRSRISAAHAGLYVVGQVVGGVLGGAIVLAIASGRSDYVRSSDGLGANGWGAASSGGYDLTATLIVEVLLTALLVFTVLTVASNSELTTIAALPIGAVLALIHLIAIPIDGTSVNPARSIASAVFAGGSSLTQLWAFIVAPLVGGVIAAVLHGTTDRAARSVAPDEVRNNR